MVRTVPDRWIELWLTIIGLNEAFSGWSNVGHNELFDLFFFYIVPK